MSSAETSEELSSLFSRIFRDRDGVLLIPFILEITTPTNNRERVVLINTISHRVIVVNASQTLETLLQDLVFDKHGGHPPASKASIQAMPTVTVDEEEAEEAECSICLDSWKVAKEMPCKHKFHGECIEKWLSVHGSCPVCRFLMPVDQSKVDDDDDDNNHVEEETEDDDNTNSNSNSNSNTSRSSNRFRVSVSYVIGRGSDDQAHDDDDDVFHDSLSGDVN